MFLSEIAVDDSEPYNPDEILDQPDADEDDGLLDLDEDDEEDDELFDSPYFEEDADEPLSDVGA